MKKSSKPSDQNQEIADLTLDLQRTRADFENYRKRVEFEKTAAREAGNRAAVLKLLPTIDTIERAITHAPKDLQDHAWVKGVVGLAKQLDKSLETLGLARINAEPGTLFNPEHHEAIQFDDEAEGEREIIASELQPGYILDGEVVRPAMVSVTRKP